MSDVPVRHGHPSEKAAPARAKTWSGVVTAFTPADRERVRAFDDANRVAMRIVGTELHVFVVLAAVVSAATLGRRMGIAATWEKSDGSPAHWLSIKSTYTILHDATHQGKKQLSLEITQHCGARSLLPTSETSTTPAQSQVSQQRQPSLALAPPEVAPAADDILGLPPLQATGEKPVPMCAAPPLELPPPIPPPALSLRATLEWIGAREQEEDRHGRKRYSLDLEVDPVAWPRRVPGCPSSRGAPELCMTNVSIQASSDSTNKVYGFHVRTPFYFERDTVHFWAPTSCGGREWELRFKVQSVTSLTIDRTAQQLRFEALTLEVRQYSVDCYAEALSQHVEALRQLVPIREDLPGLGFDSVWAKYSNRSALKLAADEKVTIEMTYAKPNDWKIVAGLKPSSCCYKNVRIRDSPKRPPSPFVMPADARDDLDPASFWEREALLNAESSHENTFACDGDQFYPEEYGSTPEADSSPPEPARRKPSPRQRRSPAPKRPKRVIRVPADSACGRCGLRGHCASDCPEVLCGNCHKPGHRAADCPMPAPCFKCGQLGHWVKDCPLGAETL